MSATAGGIHHLSFVDFFTCGMCRNNTASPTYFPCGDVICQSCYKSFLGDTEDTRTFTTKGSDDTYLDCPVCKRRSVRNRIIRLNPDVFKNLNLDRHLVESQSRPEVEPDLDPDLKAIDNVATDVRKKAETKMFATKQLYCSICVMEDNSSTEPAMNQCMDCLDLLCESCSSVHQKTRFTRDHCVVKLSDLQAGNAESERKKRFKLPCEIHTDKPLELYCLPCGQMLCLQCKLVEHNNHICTDLAPEAVNHRHKLRRDQQSLANQIQHTDQLIKECQKKAQLGRKRHFQLMDQMNGRIAFFHKQIAAYVESLFNQSSQHHREYIKKIENESKELEKLSAHLVSLKLLSGRLLDNGTDVEIVASKIHYNNKIKEFFDEGKITEVSEMEDLYLNFPQTKDLAVGILFGYLVKEKPGDTKGEILGGIRGRCHEDDGKLPHISASGRIFEAENDLRNGVLGRPVLKTDFKSCLSFVDPDKSEKTLNLHTMVMGVPDHIFSRHCSARNGSVVKAATMSNNDIVVAVFYRNYDFNQTRNCTRVRLQVYDMFGKIKMDVAYGAVIYGLAVGMDDQIIVSGGQFELKSIDIIHKDGREADSFKPRCEPGGVTVDTHDRIVVAGFKTIEFYTNDGKFIKSFADDYINNFKHCANKGFEHIRKDVALGIHEEVYVSDPNTNSVRAYSWEGELLFEYGNLGGSAPPIINPRGLICDNYGKLLVCDALSNSIHLVSQNGGLECKILDRKLNEPRDITCFNNCYFAVAQNNGSLHAFRYMFDKDDNSPIEGTCAQPLPLPAQKIKYKFKL